MNMKSLSTSRHARVALRRRDGYLRSASRTRQRGVTSLMLLVLLIPLLLAVGMAVDFARMVQFRSDLQNAVDEAALAGAAVFTDSSQSTLAQTVATNYFRRAILPLNLSVSSGTPITNASGTINPALGGAGALTVQVSATATVPTTLMSLVAPSMVTITATATAANPKVSANLAFPVKTSTACDGNTAYLYEVPANSNNTGYDYSYNALTKLSASNFYQIYTSYSLSNPRGQTANPTLPTFSVNQPLGVKLQNDTNGNSGTGNVNCGSAITGANSYGAPNGATQYFYSSLLMNGQSPSEYANYKYSVDVTTSTSQTRQGSTTNVTSYTIHPPASANPYNLSATAQTPPSGLSYANQLATIFGEASCTSTPGSSKGGSTTTTYTCTTQYRTSAQAAGNCSLYVQTGQGVTSSYLTSLQNSVPSSLSTPAPAYGKCFNMTSGGANYSAPTCAQLSALASGSGSNAVQPAAIFWWDDGGGEGPGEPSYGPASHCSGTNSSSAGYGEDCQYKNTIVALQCQSTGGSGTGYTSVVLTQ
jgi:Flp pilus assembly protein TadG